MKRYLVEMFDNGQLIDKAIFSHEYRCLDWVADKWGYLIGEKQTRTYNITEEDYIE